MFGFFRKQKQSDYIAQATEYIKRVYIDCEDDEVGKVKYSLREHPVEEPKKSSDRSGIKFSVRTEEYDFESVSSAMEQYFKTGEAKHLITELDKARNKTFTEMLIWHIAKTGKKDSAIYNAALMDRRLFSKIMSDRNYSPSKDTAVALVLALKLNLPWAEDLLKRAGYTLSHSNKRDIIIEYFIREEVYDLMVVNDVLHQLGERKIGR